jgi:FHA domain
VTARMSSPWIGLRPYTAEERAYFHGRERDERILAANLRARTLTVVYGSTGVGKSSLLLAGVVPTLRKKRAVLLFRDWQGEPFLDDLKQRCLELARERDTELDPQLPLDELLAATSRAFRERVLVVFDQFEEYFAAHPPTANGAGFEPELARAINRADVDAGFLISLREDSLAAMDRFQMRIPNLLGNMLRLEYLTAADAERAIRESLDAWNSEHQTDADIESALVPKLLADVSPHTRASLVGAAAVVEGADAVDAPLLQLVLERLWEAEDGDGSPRLTLATYERLGAAEGIVGNHFDAILDGLAPKQRELCSRFFDRLVTPSGGKIAYPLKDLEQVAAELAPHVGSTLEALDEARILRQVDSGGRKSVEIYHDVLAPTIVKWQAQILRERARAAQRRRLRRVLLAVGAGALAILAVVGYVAYTKWKDARPWATLTDVGSGNAFRLHGAQILVGRDVPGYQADVSFPDHYVSRIHLIVYRDGRALDVRSSNGTTVDGHFLRYGLGAHKLHPGDVAVIAGTEILRYAPIHYPFWHVWTSAAPNRRPTRGWAVLVEGRATRPLSGRPYFITGSGAVVHTPLRPADARAVVRWTNLDGVVLTDLADGKPLRVQCAEPNGEGYPVFSVRVRRRSDGFTIGVPRSCVLLFGGRRLQVVPLRRGRA